MYKRWYFIIIYLVAIFNIEKGFISNAIDAYSSIIEHYVSYHNYCWSINYIFSSGFPDKSFSADLHTITFPEATASVQMLLEVNKKRLDRDLTWCPCPEWEIASSCPYLSLSGNQIEWSIRTNAPNSSVKNKGQKLYKMFLHLAWEVIWEC